VTIARPDVAGQPERKLSRPYVLQTASSETIPAVREASAEQTLGRRTVRIWVFVADVTDEFILESDIRRAYDASVDVGRHVLRLGQEEVPVRSAYGVDVNAVATYRELQERAAGVLAMRKNQSSQERPSTEACQEGR
jgi:hypothetical protein